MQADVSPKRKERTSYPRRARSSGAARLLLPPFPLCASLRRRLPLWPPPSSACGARWTSVFRLASRTPPPCSGSPVPQTKENLGGVAVPLATATFCVQSSTASVPPQFGDAPPRDDGDGKDPDAPTRRSAPPPARARAQSVHLGVGLGRGHLELRAETGAQGSDSEEKRVPMSRGHPAGAVAVGAEVSRGRVGVAERGIAGLAAAIAQLMPPRSVRLGCARVAGCEGRRLSRRSEPGVRRGPDSCASLASSMGLLEMQPSDSTAVCGNCGLIRMSSFGAEDVPSFGTFRGSYTAFDDGAALGDAFKTSRGVGALLLCFPLQGAAVRPKAAPKAGGAPCA